ncbi:MAG: hypothetical protein OEX08_03675 [Candidatus Nomurabacteria bacterium]|nr:hypothetical protein [Candidatus Nomurabacteria bacterium]
MNEIPYELEHGEIENTEQQEQRFEWTDPSGAKHRAATIDEINNLKQAYDQENPKPIDSDQIAA